MPDQSRQDMLERRKSAMKVESSSFMDHWRLLSQFIKPRKGRFDRSDRNRGDRRNQKIINSIATQAHSTARAGMMAGVVSQARPWFDMVPEDPDLKEFPAVKEWTAAVKRVMYRVYRESNFYEMTQNTIGELLQFGTGCLSHVNDFENIARFYAHTIGTYHIAQNHRHVVDHWAHEYEWQTEQLVREFGLSNVSVSVRNAYDTSNYGAWWPVTHIIYPNEDYSPSRPFGTRKQYRSCYYQPGEEPKDKFLREEGFDEFPVYVPRWDVTYEDIWGSDCPAMTALGDIIGLQTQEREKAKGIQKMVSPPLTGPASLRSQPVSALPNGLTTYDGEGQNQLRSIYNINPQVNELRQDILDVSDRINHAFYVHLFRAITDMKGIQPRNELELFRREQERLLELGPVLGRLYSDFLNNLLDRTFNQIMRADGGRGLIVPPVPQELSEQPLRWEFTGTLAMAQKELATGPIERVTAYVGGIAQMKPDIFDKFDADQAVDEYAEAVGLPHRIIVSDDVVAEIRRARQQQQMAETAAAGANSAADTVQKLSKADTSDKNALTDIAEAT